MDELLRIALQAVRSPIRSAEVRIAERQRSEHLAVQNGEAKALTVGIGQGFGARVRTRSAWGFAATSTLTPEAIRETVRKASRAAVTAEKSRSPVLSLTSDKGPDNGSYASRVRLPPFDMPREEKLNLLIDAERRLHSNPRIKTGLASMQAWEEVKWFASTEGGRYRSSITHVGAGVQATAVEGGQVQRRSAPTSFGGDFHQAGFEFIQALDLVSQAERVGREAVDLLHAPPCPTGKTTLVIGSDQLALQVHESVGHATELDRIYGTEAGFAGTSWVDPRSIGSLPYGSRLMNITADATTPGGLGTFGWDDEGVPARRVPLVTRGKLVGALSSRETAAAQGWSRSGGAMRAEGALRMPLVRMTNMNLEPGASSFDELLDGVRSGVYVTTNRSWSIDDQRLNFQFGCELGRKIVAGELGPVVRNPIYSGMTPEFWASMDAVGNAATWHLWGVPNCGKGQPQQVARVGHGAPAARFRGVAVRGGN